MKQKPLTQVDHTIIERLSLLRENMNKSRREVIEELNGQISMEQLKSYELESRFSEPTPEHLVILAKYYGVSTDYILGLSDTMNEIPEDDSVDGTYKVSFSGPRNQPIQTLFSLKFKEKELIGYLITSIDDMLDLIELSDSLKKDLNENARLEMEDEDSPDMSDTLRSSMASMQQINATRDSIIYNICHILDDCLRSIVPNITSPYELMDSDVLDAVTAFIERINKEHSEESDEKNKKKN